MKEQKRIILLALFVSILLMLVKFVAFFITSSNAILTDAAESIVNVLASAFAFYSIYLSAQPRDLNHPYGHGKVEFFSMFVEGILILIAGILIIFKSAYNLFYPAPVDDLFDGTLIIAATGIINFGLGYYLIDQSKRLNSVTLFADGKHLQTDAYSSAGLVAGLLIIYFTNNYYLDSILSVVMGIYIIYNGYKLVRRSVGGLMDESDLEKVKEIVAILNENRRPSWIDIHNLRTQSYGHELHIDCHVTLPYYFELNKVHDEISELDTLINQKGAVRTEFFIHTDPCLPQCCHYCRMPKCPVRNEVQLKDITWTVENVTRNHKHYQ
ncbi:cation diffusion facilitator family transporter [Pedobacter sp. SYSU D00535]|uniref:cation diffusion facilitator family transporter n=1 Tax=Pedobacter sp. SYSU D00535 TaxID=2810308 RepID=UPI001A965476|nr:cation diffusion facilitator family transporter [Pedobacter sp. SYSU D00535]